MKRNKHHLISYLAALVIGVILFAVFWKTFFGSASSPVVIAGIVGVAVAVILFLIIIYRKSNNNDK
jgi:hypothetical protein